MEQERERAEGGLVPEADFLERLQPRHEPRPDLVVTRRVDRLPTIAKFLQVRYRVAVQGEVCVMHVTTGVATLC